MYKGTDIITFTIDKFSEYLNITACYRQKTRCSSEPNENNDHLEILQGLNVEGIEREIEYEIAGKKCFIHTDSNLHSRRLSCEKYTDQFRIILIPRK